MNDLIRPGVHRISRALGRFGERLRHPLGRATRRRLAPSLQLAERANDYVATVDLPGVRAEDLDVRVAGNLLTVRAERRAEANKRTGGTDYAERSNDTFSRSLSMPAGADLGRIEADFERGVLEIRIPKSTEARGRNIPVSRTGHPDRELQHRP